MPTSVGGDGPCTACRAAGGGTTQIQDEGAGGPIPLRPPGDTKGSGSTGASQGAICICLISPTPPPDEVVYIGTQADRVMAPQSGPNLVRLDWFWCFVYLATLLSTYVPDPSPHDYPVLFYFMFCLGWWV